MEKNQLTPTDLITIRKSRNLTQTEIATIFGVEIKSIQRWEKGDSIDGRTRLAYIWIRDANPAQWKSFQLPAGKRACHAISKEPDLAIRIQRPRGRPPRQKLD